MKTESLFISTLMLLLSMTTQAQKLTVESMQATNDLSASTDQLDLYCVPHSYL